MRYFIFLLLLGLTGCSLQKVEPVKKEDIVPQSTVKPTPTVKPSISPTETPARKTKFTINTHVGTAEMIGDKEMCLVVQNDGFVKGDKVSAIYADTSHTFEIVQAVVESSVARCGIKNHEPDRNEPYFHYKLRITSDNKIMQYEKEYPVLNLVAIALVNSPKPVSLKRGVANADLNGDRQQDGFRTCTSMEGIHLTVWAGAPLKSKRLWHWYIDLPFDTVPTCTVKDYED